MAGTARTPDESINERFGWGGVELHFDVERGHITRTQVFTDSLNPAPLEALASRLQGCVYQPDAMKHTCEMLIPEFPDQEQPLRDVAQWLAEVVR